MNIREFAVQWRLRVARDECDELVISGKRGHIYEHSSAALGLLFMPGRGRLWANAKKKIVAAGFTIRQDGEEEGTALFDPLNSGQVRLAIKLTGVKTSRVPSRAQLEALRKARDARRIEKIRCAEAHVAAQKRRVVQTKLPGQPFQSDRTESPTLALARETKEASHAH